MAHPAQQIMLQEYIHSVEECTQRVHRLTEQILQLMPDWRMHHSCEHCKPCAGWLPWWRPLAVAEIGPWGALRNPGS